MVVGFSATCAGAVALFQVLGTDATSRSCFMFRAVCDLPRRRCHSLPTVSARTCPWCSAVVAVYFCWTSCTNTGIKPTSVVVGLWRVNVGNTLLP